MNILLIKIIFLLSISSYKLRENSHNKLGEVFTGLKTQNKFRIYTPILMTRRMIYVLILISITSISSKIVIGILSAVQIGYGVYIVYLRPFSRVKDNLIEILLETYFITLIFTLIFSNTSSDWSSFLISAYMWIIASSNIVVLLITLSKERVWLYSWFIDKSHNQAKESMKNTYRLEFYVLNIEIYYIITFTSTFI